MLPKNFYFIIFLLSQLAGEVYYVPGDYASIQNAIDVSDDGDTVLISQGTYAESINFNGKSILVSSRYFIDNDSTLIANTIIDAQSSGSVATFSSGETDQSVLQGLTLQNGNGNDADPDGNGSFYKYGGGVYCENSDPIIRNCIINNNIANEGGGGGIFCYSSSPKFINCTINQNETDDVGGGLYARASSSPEFYDCTFEENLAEFGGGCYLRNESYPIMENVIFNNNTANNSGGGITLKDDANLVANGLQITNNEAEGLGGGLYINNADPQLDYTLIADNVSSSGAGIYVRNTSVVNLTNFTIANNLAALYGNAIYMRDDAEVALVNSVLWSNGDPQVYFRSEGIDVELNIDYSIVEGGQSSIETNDNGDLEWGSGNLDQEPFFCNSSEGNYEVRENSPCIDGGQGGNLIGCFGVGCGPINLGPVWYVGQSGDNANDGSIDAPFETISRAMSSAVDGDTIRLKQGAYSEPFDFENKDIVLESRAFELEDEQIISDTYFTVGQSGGTCLTLNGPSNNEGKIRGIAFKGGFNSSGGGLAIINCSPILEKLKVENNSADIGGGIFLSGSDAILKSITIRENGANMGGGLYVTGGNPILENTIIEENFAYWGGGLYSDNSDFTISIVRFRQNEAFIEGAGIYQSSGSSEIEWTSFERNNGYDYGGSIAAFQTSLNINQATFAENTSGVGSVFSAHGSYIVINNSIIWDNYGPILYAPESSGVTEVELNFSDIQGATYNFSNYSNIIFNTFGGVFEQDPEFCHSTEQPFAIKETSPCINASDSLGIIGAYDIVCDQLQGEEDFILNRFQLLQNFPNPFNPITYFEFSLENNGYYQLSIFNIKGEYIKTIKTGYGFPGNYTAKWDATDSRGEKVSSGVYFYHLITNKNFASKKMILLK